MEGNKTGNSGLANENGTIAGGPFELGPKSMDP